MPCYSKIQTKLTDSDRIAEAMTALGYVVFKTTEVVKGTKSGRITVFQKSGTAFSVLGDTTDLVGISRKYAEIGVRNWARKSGYAVEESNGQRMTLVNRRA